MRTQKTFDQIPYVVETGTGVLCDSRAQIEKVAALDAEVSAIQTINASEPKACTYAEVRFIRGASYGQVHLSKRTFEVVEVLVLGFNAQGEWRQLSRWSNGRCFRSKRRSHDGPRTDGVAGAYDCPGSGIGFLCGVSAKGLSMNQKPVVLALLLAACSDPRTQQIAPSPKVG